MDIAETNTATNTATDPETIVVDSTTVACDGGASGHPNVYLNLGKDGRVECPYCGQRFVLAGNAKVGTGH